MAESAGNCVCSKSRGVSALFKASVFSRALLALQTAWPCAAAFHAQICVPGRACLICEGSHCHPAVTIFQRYLSGVSHVAVRHVATRVAVADPVSDGRPYSLFWPHIPGTLIIYHPGDTTDDTKFTAQDLINLVNRGDIR